MADSTDFLDDNDLVDFLQGLATTLVGTSTAGFLAVAAHRLNSLSQQVDELEHVSAMSTLS